MNPTPQTRKILASSNVYTAFLGITLGILVAAAAFVAFKCLVQYETLFSVPQ